MTALWIFLAVCPLAMASLLVFASHIDPLSGRWRGARLACSLHVPDVRERGRRLGAAVKHHAAASRTSPIACSESPSTGS
ncbi:hypothetical protein PAMC26577_18140 [Caballeronia sordidicola]|uniref:Uncharacterized protein n=1 Tax=Caballeronia sordidicola TaxID=196367 RepID=A0A242MQJ3_CABSO|nr:hypothetical protein PAMC26577_18140 [Caballeronia sordidicola]